MKWMNYSTEDHTIPHLNITFNFNLFDIVTDRKQSVCHSVRGGGVEGVFVSQHASQVTWPGGLHQGGLRPGDLHSGGLH